MNGYRVRVVFDAPKAGKEIHDYEPEETLPPETHLQCEKFVALFANGYPYLFGTIPVRVKRCRIVEAKS